MTRMKLMVFVLGAALVLLVPAVAQAQTVVVNNNSSTQSTSTATSGGHSATTTTSGVGSTGVQVAGGAESLDMENTGSSTSAAVAGPNGATANGNSTNESDISLDCGNLACAGQFNCVNTICTPVVIGGGGTIITNPNPNPTITIIPVPTNTTGVNDLCEAGLLGCLLSNPDLNLDLADVLDLGDVLTDVLGGSPVLSDLLEDLDLDLDDLLGGGILSGGGLGGLLG